jgi:hypothetical protein
MSMNRAAALAHLLIGIVDRRRAACSLNPEYEVLVELGIRRSVLGAHLRPVGIHFLGDQCGKAGERSLPKLDMLDQHGHCVVAGNANKGVRCERLFFRPCPPLA